MGSERDVAELVRSMRCDAALSQRQLAERAGTSGPTIADYEQGKKEPRLSTLERLAAGAGYQVELALVSTHPGASARARRRRRSLSLAAAVCAAFDRNPTAARALADENLAKMAGVVGDNDSQTLLQAWRRALDGGAAAVRTVLLDPTADGDDMRQLSPFAGLLGQEERQAALDAADAFDAMRATS